MPKKRSAVLTPAVGTVCNQKKDQIKTRKKCGNYGSPHVVTPSVHTVFRLTIEADTKKDKYAPQPL